MKCRQHSGNEAVNTGQQQESTDVCVLSRPPEQQQHRSGMPNSNLVVAVATRTKRTWIVVFGIMKISRVRLLAMLSGLRLESEIVSLHTSLAYKEKVRIGGGLSNRPQVQQQQQHFPR